MSKRIDEEMEDFAEIDIPDGDLLASEEARDETEPAEAYAAKDLSALEHQLTDDTKRYADRFRTVTDSEFWVALCFQTRAQKEAFLQAANWLALGDKYIDGRRVARAMGIDLPPVVLPAARRRIDKTLAAMAAPVEGGMPDDGKR